MSRQRFYMNGYGAKIQYWQEQYDSAKSNGNMNTMLRALDKLTYFVQRQKEVYGTL